MVEPRPGMSERHTHAEDGAAYSGTESYRGVPDQDDDKTHPFQSLFLIGLESTLTFMLRHDAQTQLQARYLINQHAVVCIRTYLPSQTFYATFTERGLLLDRILSQSKIDATVSASTIDLLRAFFFASDKVLDGIRIDGNQQIVSEIRSLMHYLNVPFIASSWLNQLKSFGLEKDDGSHQQRRIKPLLKRIDGQQHQIQQLTVLSKEQASQIRHLKTRMRRQVVVFTVISFLLVIATVVMATLLFIRTH